MNITLSDEELLFLKAVVPPRKLSRFIKEAALARAHEVQRQNLRRQIVQAYQADPEFLQEAGAEWDSVAHENWPQP
ncbi:MAG: hypothetical protein HY319_09605 [Armatimonadetes bacterium]|nr:hypothetical protein [Armatimonadota bacterium]